MKKVFAFTLLFGSCAAAWSQASDTTTIYGIVDAGLNRVTGLKGGSQTQLASGIMDGSRLGFTGGEDMGGGWKAIFALESRFEINNGTLGSRPSSGLQVPDRLANADLLGLPAALQPAVTAVASGIAQSQLGVNLRNSIFDRKAYVGLVTPVGAVLLGRQYTPAFEVFATFDNMKFQSSLSAGQIGALPSIVDIRADNALAYRAQQGPFTVSAMLALGQSGAFANKRLIGALGMYQTDAYSVGVGYNERNNELGEKALRSAIFGATVAVGPGKFSGLYATVKDDHPADLSSIAAGLVASTASTPTPISLPVAQAVQKAFTEGLKQNGRLASIGYTLVSGALTSYVSFNRYNDLRPANADIDSYGVAYSYALSKRTDINLVLTHFNNKNLAQAAPGGNGFQGGVTASAGTDSNNFALGLRHRF